MSETTNSGLEHPYKRIVQDIDEWPIAKINKDKAGLIEEVVEETLKNILAKNKTEEDLHNEIAKAVYLEKIRLDSRAWKTDPTDDKEFWNKVKNKLVELEAYANHKTTEESELLKEIIRRYVKEITGNFSKRTYNFAERFVPFAFNRLLNSSNSRAFRRVLGNKKSLLKSINLVGEIEQARALAKDNIIIAVPTHSSNIDSITVGWAISAIGLPSFFYGAGLNLFSVRFLAFFMNRLGAYKVDRRKKNSVYLEALKSFSTIVIMKGGHSLFFPGGTRSRSGHVESQLKLGLLGTALDAQRRLIIDAGGSDFKKIYVMPITLNYGFVLEAPALIDEYLRNVGKERYYVPGDKYSSSYKLIKFMLRFFTADGDFTIAFGKCMDIFGNPVNAEGKSIDNNGNEIDIRDYFKSKGELKYDTQRDSVYTKMLSESIIEAFHTNTVVMPENLIAFIAFKLFQKKNPEDDIYSILRIPEEFRTLQLDELTSAVAGLQKELIKMAAKQKIRISPLIEGEPKEIVEYGIKKMGVYHAKRPLRILKNGVVKCQDMKVLLFYHNRLEGFGLEKHV